MRLLLLSLSITFGVISVASAKDADCMGERNDAQFRACSKIIKSKILYNKKITSKNLAHIYINRGQYYYYNKGLYDKALADFDQATILDSSNTVAYIERGKVFNKRKQYDRALTEYNQAIRLKTRFEHAYNGRGKSYYFKGQYNKAIADFDKAIRINPKYVNAYINRGHVFSNKKQYDRALINYNKAIRLDPKQANAYSSRAVIHSFKGEYNKAIIDLDQAIRLDSENAKYYSERGNVYLFKKLFDKASDDYTTALHLNPKDAEAYGGRGYIYLIKGLYDKAIAEYKQAIQLNPKSTNFYNNRGHSYNRIGLYDKAIADFDKANRLDPKFANPYNHRGYAFNQKGLFQKAIKDLNKAISLKPKYASAYNRRAYSYYKLGKIELAQLDAEKAVALDPKSKDYKKTLDEILSSNVVVAEKKATKKEKTKVANLEKKQKAYRSTGKRIALVVGNDKYQNLSANAQLQKAQNDARSTAETFTSLGFDVMRGFNLKRRDMNVQLTRLANKIEPGDEVMFFFAGHGVRIEGQNYLLPTDIPPISEANEDLLKSESLRVDRISEMFRKKGARLSVLILDACRDNPYKDTRGRSVGGTRGLAPMDPPEGTLVLFSAGAGQQALDRLSDDDKNPNSVFTRTFLPMIKQEGLELSRLSKLVKAKVRELAKTVGHNQTPAVYDEVIGDVFLAKQ